jgi:hypothetical protein
VPATPAQEAGPATRSSNRRAGRFPAQARLVPVDHAVRPQLYPVPPRAVMPGACPRRGCEQLNLMTTAHVTLTDACSPVAPPARIRSWAHWMLGVHPDPVPFKAWEIET